MTGKVCEDIDFDRLFPVIYNGPTHRNEFQPRYKGTYRKTMPTRRWLSFFLLRHGVKIGIELAPSKLYDIFFTNHRIITTLCNPFRKPINTRLCHHDSFPASPGNKSRHEQP